MGIELDVVVLPAFTDLDGLPGERDPWVEGYDLDGRLAVSGVPGPLFYGDGLGVVPTGIGKTAAAATTTALLACEDLDLSETLFLSVGIAGGPPSEVTVGSVVLAEAIVDWDNKSRWHADDGASSIAETPYDADRGVFEVDADRLARAERIAADVELADDPDVTSHGRRYDHAAAQSDPTVVTGLSVCSDELWHGHRIAEQVRDLFDDHGSGEYCATQMEDVGTAFALDRFGHQERYLSVRGISNFDRPAPSQSVEDSLFGDGFEAGVPLGLENAVRVASAVVDERLG